MNIILKIEPKVVVDNSTEVPDDALHLFKQRGVGLCGFKGENAHNCPEIPWDYSMKFCINCGKPICSICICEAIRSASFD